MNIIDNLQGYGEVAVGVGQSALATFDEIATFAEKVFGKQFMKWFSKKYKG